MFESSQKASVVYGLAAIYLLLVFVYYNLTKTYLLSFTLEIALFPLSFPLMSLCFVYALTIYLVVIKLSLIFATVYILHNAFACFFALNKLALVYHTFEDFLLTEAMWFRVIPLAFI
jgi:hypothetical protein